MNRIFSALVLALCFAGYGQAQMASTGTVIGTVTDPSGAVIPGAQIELTDTTTGNARTALSNGSGQYSFVGVQPGTYAVKGTHTGFEAVSVPNVVVEIEKSYTINLRLQVGAAPCVLWRGAAGVGQMPGLAPWRR